MPPADHIHWPVFPILAARLKQIEVKLAQGHSLPALYSKDESRQVLAGLDSSIRGTNVASCTGAPILDTYLEKIHGAFVSNHVLPDKSPQSQALIDSVSQLFCSKPCNKCGAATKCIASAAMANAQAVHQFGECIGLLRQLFAFVVEFCRELYARYAPDTAPPALALHTHRLGKRNPMLELAVSAVTREQQPGHRSINIHLKVNEVDLDEYFACLYIMFHECFVHGWCGPALDSATASSADAFHEGWMDSVGYDLLDERLRTGYHQLPGHLMTHWREFGTAGVKARQRRLTYWPLETHRSAAIYATGEMAARVLLRFFHFVLEDPPRAQAQFLRFSLSLNASQVDDEQRRNLVLRVLERLNGRGAALSLIKNMAVSHAIERFAGGGPFQDLLHVLDSG